MAVSIDGVYQKVLALANKEQRGYITPQEFNLFADHAQREIFEQYFFDLDQFRRGIKGAESDFTPNIQTAVEQKLSKFLTSAPAEPMEGLFTPNFSKSLGELGKSILEVSVLEL